MLKNTIETVKFLFRYIYWIHVTFNVGTLLSLVRDCEISCWVGWMIMVSTNVN